MESRSRSLTQPGPGGVACPHRVETRACAVGCCPFNCVMGQFGEWSECTKSCGAGERGRSRSMVAPSACGGLPCASSLETEPCTEGLCPIHCKVSAFTGWSACSQVCGSGSQNRTRVVLAAGGLGGYVCPFLSESRTCNDYPCPVDCKVHEFDDWGDCSVTCGRGEQLRQRRVETPLWGGKACPHSTENQYCESVVCPTTTTSTTTIGPTPAPTPERPYGPGSCPRCESVGGQVLMRLDTRLATHVGGWRCYTTHNACKCSCPHPEPASAGAGCQEVEAFGMRRAVGSTCTESPSVPNATPSTVGALADSF